MSAETETEVFIVRIWHEPREDRDAGHVWRGTVEHLESKEVQHFNTLARLLAFIARHAGLPGAPDGR